MIIITLITKYQIFKEPFQNIQFKYEKYMSFNQFDHVSEEC